MFPDQEARDNILTDPCNILVSASAGSGKTTIMISKIKEVLESIKTHKTIAAITFTIKATQEIREKALNQGVQSAFVSNTNDSFVENEIIRPFISDALGIEYKSSYVVEYDRRYKFNRYEQGLYQLKCNDVLGTYRNNELNFNFELALKILKQSRAAREYLQAKYEMIFIDEYQDSDLNMHELFMYFYDELNIKLFIVGDEKQAIYIWRGAQKNIFSLIPNTFNKYKLIKNFRCNDEIINYANLLYENDILNLDIAEPVQHVVHIDSSGLVDNFKQLINIDVIDPCKDVTILANRNDHAKQCADDLQLAGYDFIFVPRTPLDEGSPNSFILKELGKFLKQENYSAYDLIVQTNLNEDSINIQHLNKLLNKLVLEVETSDENHELRPCTDYLNINLTDNEVAVFYRTMRNSEYDIAFEDREDQYQVMTVFGSKGLEFDQVISFSSYYSIFRNRELQNHYVCITRAKEKFVMIIDDPYYEKHLDRIAYENGIEDTKLLYMNLS